MPAEIEGKFRVEQLTPYSQRLAALDAIDQGLQVQEDRYFDRPDGSLRAGDIGLRLRRVSHGRKTRNLLCFKGPRQEGPFKHREEIECVVGDADAATAFLQALGYVTTLTVRKRRHLWRHDDCDVCLDDLGELGCFVEIEGPDNASIAAVAAALHLADHECIHESYVSMLARHRGLGGPGPVSG